MKRAYEPGAKPASASPARDGGVDSSAVEGRRRISIFAAAVLAALIVAWAAVNLATGGEGFARPITEGLHGGEEATSAVARLFAALVLALFPVEGIGWRVRWVAGGLGALGLGHLIFGYVEPLVQNDPPDLNEALYEVFVTQTFACALFAIGLFPGTPPRFLRRVAMIIPAVLVGGYIVIFEFMDGEEWMPPMTEVKNPESTVKLGASLNWLTHWHWELSALPLFLALVSAAGAFWLSRRGLLRSWLLFAMVLLAGSVLHDYLWPAAYGRDVLTTADGLRLAFAVVVAVGGVAELRRVAQERANLLANERERARRLDELNALRADFSAMVAHELDGPIAAIRRLNEMVDKRGEDTGLREYAAAATEGELDALTALVSDVRAAAAVERDDFSVEPRPLPLEELLDEAEGYARTLPGGHPVRTVPGEASSEWVVADPERVGQILRNLLSNAAKYSPEGAPIELRAIRGDGRIRIEVADSGLGIRSEDLARIFEKFGRGRDQEGRKVPGVGLGLYLSRRIARAHGTDLMVESEPGRGSVFAFELEAASR